MFVIHIKLSNGQFERVSPPIFSDLIEAIFGIRSDEIDRFFPNQLCERDCQMIFIRLNEKVEKRDLRITCNGKNLSDKDFQIAKTILSFESPACIQDKNNLHVQSMSPIRTDFLEVS
ncbi:unnamed protein product, partial [Rotaria sp. Silwood2]